MSNKEKLSQFRSLEERVEKTHKMVDESLLLLETEKAKGIQLSEELGKLTAQLEKERNRQSDYFEGKIQEEIEATLNSVVMEEIQAQRKLKETLQLIREREAMTKELEYMAAGNKKAPKELKTIIAKYNVDEPKKEAERKSLKEENKSLSNEIKTLNGGIATQKQSMLEWERKVNSMRDLLPYMNQYVEGDSIKAPKQKDASSLKKPFEVKKQTPKTKAPLMKDDDDFWVGK